MPSYTYRCKTCLKEFNIEQSIHDSPLKLCKENPTKSTCDGQLFRVIGKNIGIQFSGAGFYINDQSTKTASPSSQTPTSKPKKASPKPKQENKKTT